MLPGVPLSIHLRPLTAQGGVCDRRGCARPVARAALGWDRRGQMFVMEELCDTEDLDPDLDMVVIAVRGVASWVLVLPKPVSMTPGLRDWYREMEALYPAVRVPPSMLSGAPARR